MRITTSGFSGATEREIIYGERGVYPSGCDGLKRRGVQRKRWAIRTAARLHLECTVHRIPSRSDDRFRPCSGGENRRSAPRYTIATCAQSARARARAPKYCGSTFHSARAEHLFVRSEHAREGGRSRCSRFPQDDRRSPRTETSPPVNC